MDHITQKTLLNITGEELDFTEEEIVEFGLSNAYDAILKLKKVLRYNRFGEFDLSQKLSVLGIPGWLVGRLRREGIDNFFDLYEKNEDWLLRQYQIGKTSVRRLNEALVKIGLPKID